MKILYVHEAAIESGKANVLQGLSMCNAFSQNGIDVILFMLSDENFNIPDTNEFITNKYGIPVNFKVDLYKQNDLRFARYTDSLKVKSAIRRHRPDICYVRSSLKLDRCVRSKQLTVYESHNYRLHQKNDLIDLYLRKRLFKALKTPYLKKIVTISENLKRYWVEQGVDKDKLFSYHDGFDENKFNIKSREDAKGLLGISDKRKIVMYTGSLFTDRRVENILELAVHFPEAVFYIIGGPDDKADIIRSQAFKDNINNLIVTGHVPHSQIPLYLSAADVLLALWSKSVPTINYCSPLKLFEYMASGRIIIAHGFPTIKEVITDGVNGLVCDPESTGDLLSKLRLALKMDYPNDIAENARKNAFDNYTWDIRAKKIIESISD